MRYIYTRYLWYLVCIYHTRINCMNAVVVAASCSILPTYQVIAPGTSCPWYIIYTLISGMYVRTRFIRTIPGTALD